MADFQELTKKEIKLQQAPKYCNVLYNNEKTPMDVVVAILMHIFKYSMSKAEKMTYQIHESEKGIVFVGSKESCTTKDVLIGRLLTNVGEGHLKHSVELYEEEGN